MRQGPASKIVLYYLLASPSLTTTNTQSYRALPPIAAHLPSSRNLKTSTLRHRSITAAALLHHLSRDAAMPLYLPPLPRTHIHLRQPTPPRCVAALTQQYGALNIFTNPTTQQQRCCSTYCPGYILVTLTVCPLPPYAAAFAKTVLSIHRYLLCNNTLRRRSTASHQPPAEDPPLHHRNLHQHYTSTDAKIPS